MNSKRYWNLIHLACLQKPRGNLMRGLWLQKLKLLRSPIRELFGVWQFMTVFYKHLSGPSGFLFSFESILQSIIYKLSLPSHHLILQSGGRNRKYLGPFKSAQKLLRAQFHTPVCLKVCLRKIINDKTTPYGQRSEKIRLLVLWKNTATKPNLRKSNLCSYGVIWGCVWWLL